MELQQILQQFQLPNDVTQVSFLGNAGGFSGASIWKCQTESKAFCLRRWPREHPNSSQLTFIHRIIESLHQFHFIPSLVETDDQQTFYSANRNLWELADWMPGRADYWTDPHPKKMIAAMTGLGQIHASISSTPEWCIRKPSPGLAFRFERLRELMNVGMELQNTIDYRYGPEIFTHCVEIIELARRQAIDAIDRISHLIDVPVRLQPSLRDIWHDHVLFDGHRLSGFIDFGAIRIESPAGDVARLLGSLVGDSTSDQALGLAAYRREFNLEDKEIAIIRGFDAANIVLSGVNWIRWLYIDNRKFEEMSRVEERLMQIKSRLNNAKSCRF